MTESLKFLMGEVVLAHSKPSTTLDIYGHLYSEKQGEVARLMDELVTPVMVTLPPKVSQETP